MKAQKKQSLATRLGGRTDEEGAGGGGRRRQRRRRLGPGAAVAVLAVGDAVQGGRKVKESYAVVKRSEDQREDFKAQENIYSKEAER
ncbi:unnamed protein product [Linum trigynum]|uniref:Uncharacterized protein n=1 Tax=Linum trigynum TaxID=586398 RepID=A0AAV2E4V4_9ROSI